MSIQLAAIVVLYHPPLEVVQNISSYAADCQKIYLIDNTGGQPKITLPAEWADKAVWFLQEENVGVAKALNLGMRMAIADGFEWVMTMDQDSSFDNAMISHYIQWLNQQDKESLAMVGPGYGNATNQRTEVMETNRLITSGAIIHTAAFIKTGWFNEELFIDEVDHEYCYRLRLNHYKILQQHAIYMHHRLGEKGNNKLTASRSFHSPIRLYYMVRNGCRMIHQYSKDFPEETAATKKDMLIRIKNNLLFGPNRLQSLHYIVKGYLDYKKHKFGKL